MKSKLKYILPILGIAVAVGIGVGASPRAVTLHNDIIFGENGPIKLIAPDGVVLLSNATQVITSEDYIHAGGGGEVVKRYPFFILDLNDGFSIAEGGSTWLGVELKASTNNFGMALISASHPIPTPEEKHPCFWSCTEISGTDTWVDPELENMDECWAFTTYNGTNNVDNRAWCRYTTILQLIDTSEGLNLKCPRKIGVLIHLDGLKNSDGKWLRSDNDDIVWCYMRTDATGPETNSFGKAIWTICEPACWFKSVPYWANHGRNGELPIGQ